MEKLSALAGERADDGRSVEGAVVEIDQINTPLARLRVVEAQRLGFDMQLAVGAGHLELLEVGVAVEELVVVGKAIVLNPGIGIDELSSLR